MIFMDVEIEVGDMVSIISPTVPLPHIPASVIDVEDGVLKVMSTLLVPFQHSGKFSRQDVSDFEVMAKAEHTIPREARNFDFRKHTLVETTIQGRCVQGQIIAAFDGVVVAKSGSGKLVTGVTNHWRLAS